MPPRRYQAADDPAGPVGGSPLSSPPATRFPASERVTRLFYRVLGVAALSAGLLALEPFSAQVPLIQPLTQPYFGASVLAWLLVVGLPVSVGVLATRAPLRVLRALILVGAACYVLVLFLWVLLRADPLPAGHDIPWILHLSGVTAIAVAMCSSGRVAWTYSLSVCLLAGITRGLTTNDDRPLLVGFQDLLYSLLIISIFVALALGTRRSAASVDETERVARLAQADRAAHLARRRERLTVDALVHDSVLSTLLIAGLGSAEPAVIARQATASLDQLQVLRDPERRPTRPAVTQAVLVRRLDNLIGQTAPDAQLHCELNAEPPGGGALPAEAATAILGAVGEALRNSVAWAAAGAGRAVRRSVTVRAAAGGIKVVVRDDGVGFDPDAIAPERAGITQSIIGRLERVPGGLATVRSRPGAGTVIAITWTPSLAPAGLSGTDAPASAPETGAPAAPAGPAPTHLLGLSRRMTRLILALFIALHGLFTLTTLDTSRSVPLEIVSTLLIAAAAVAVVAPAREPLSRGRTAGILLLSAAATLIMYARTDTTQVTASAFWHVGAVTVILLILVARGRWKAAWSCYLGLAGSTVVWALANALDPLTGLPTMVHHAVILVAGTLLVLGLGRMEGALTGLAAQLAAADAAEATLTAATRERALQLARVNTLARPALQRVARGILLTDAERADCLLVEATMRDAIRGRCLFVDPVIAAARAARIRGVEVSLLDDHGDHDAHDAHHAHHAHDDDDDDHAHDDDDDRHDAHGSDSQSDRAHRARIASIAAIVAGELNATMRGSFTARVLPAGRPYLATIVIDDIDDVEQRMLVIAPDGTLQ
ncbi:sensor histidine kinase [Cryobacterium frigoriphilum]|uniref:sensor histidine kinase n=1 Tax=Cryobacterium frigoriphilum TaxID=1259150 RepID=UPI00141BD48E|nr:hypothetical protein [Cryobacterium frigoriphilum]